MTDYATDPGAVGEGRLFRLKDFEGPLDLLLFLIRKNEVSIYDIPIASITEQYLGFLDGDEGVDLDDLTDFYSMAASLIYIKSRMLLPVDMDDDEPEDPRRELIEKLIEYQRFKRLSDLMERKEMEVEWSVERKKIQRPLPFAVEAELWERIDVWDLLRTFSSLVSNLSSERIIDLYEEVSINEKTALIHELLDSRQSFRVHRSRRQTAFHDGHRLCLPRGPGSGEIQAHFDIPAPPLRRHTIRAYVMREEHGSQA